MNKYVKYCVISSLLSLFIGGLHADMQENKCLSNFLVFPENYTNSDKEKEKKKDHEKERDYIPYIPITMGPWW